MAKIKLIVEELKTLRGSGDHWKDWTTYVTVEVEVPDWLAEGINKADIEGSMRVLGAEKALRHKVE